mmetsp:Transcript_116325/g.329047  ORF Transcript_116325/g.329047 Transcript_116325/m.329047 type:complete len:929 (+) Transcript_116325:105-2891(+)
MAGQWDSLKEKIATAVKANLKVEEREFVNPWSSQDKASVLQQTRCFGDTPIDAPKCMELCTRVLYLIQQGEKFTANELTSLFFGVTKLFQSTNTRLRRMVYLLIKDLDPNESEVFIITSSLIKDMNSKNDCFRANSIRVLSRILDAAMVAQIDRYLKTAIVDKNPFVSSSALVCGVALMKTAPDVVRRWVSEVQESVSSKHSMVQFHALALIYEVKKTDRLALHKVVMGLAKTSSKSPLAECLLIRYAAQTLMTERDSAVEKTLMAYLDSCLRNSNSMVSFEAARAFCQLVAADTEGSGTTVFGHDMTQATTLLQISLNSPKSVVRFGAVRTLNLLAQHRPQVAARCNCDMEPLLTDQNRNTATLALTTLLKTGHESNVERLVKQITSFMSEISDAFKVEVVRAVKGLCLQYPSKYKTLMQFLSANLREDGTCEFKKDLVEAIILVIGQVPPAKESGLLHLCEYIEDCEFPSLCSKVLAFLGEEVPSTAQPPKYVRFIYNRLILESPLVRASAVDALAKIAMKCPSLRRDILVLLRFGELDEDDEVRDRIGLYTTVLESCLMEQEGGSAGLGFQSLVGADIPFSLDAMYDGLLAHMCSDRSGDAFCFDDIPSEEAYKVAQKAQAAVAGEKKRPGVPGASAAGRPGVPAAATTEKVAEQKAAATAELQRVIAEIVPGGDIGPLQHSCRPQLLTEGEAEYTVQVIKHMFREHVVLEMYVSNTVSETLENVEVRLTGLEPSWSEVGASAITRLQSGQQASSHVVLRKAVASEDVAGAVIGSFGAALHFLVKEEGDDLGYEDDYPVENVTIALGDYMFPRPLAPNQFKSVWEQLSAGGEEATERMSLNFKTLEAAVDYIVQTLNMEPCDKTGRVETGVRGHTVLMSGIFVGGNMAVVKALVGLAPNQGCIALQIKCRAKSPAVCSLVVQALM